ARSPATATRTRSTSACRSTIRPRSDSVKVSHTYANQTTILDTQLPVPSRPVRRLVGAAGVIARSIAGRASASRTSHQGAEIMLTPGITRRKGRIAATAALLIGLAGVATSAAADNATTQGRLGLSSVRSDTGGPAATTRARTTAADQCGFVPAVPADRFKGIPVFNPVAAARPYTVVFHTTQGDITVRALTSAAVHYVLVPLPDQSRVLQRN